MSDNKQHEPLAKWALMFAAITSIALFAVILILGAHMRSEMQWDDFTHCRLMDLERGDVAHKCELEPSL